MEKSKTKQTVNNIIIKEEESAGKGSSSKKKGLGAGPTAGQNFDRLR